VREQFWKEVNDARKLNQCRYWKNIFPEASVMDINCLTEVNQYLSITGAENSFIHNKPMVGPVHSDVRVKPFYTEFISNFERQGTETNWNALFFYSLSDISNAFEMHSDTESVFLIQGYGDVGMVISDAETSEKTIYHLKTGDAILIPPLTIHKPIPIGPRVTLSIGSMPNKYMPMTRK
jgi:mannose-6-phosphate isomerase-like protein (cupin superfamily)